MMKNTEVKTFIFYTSGRKIRNRHHEALFHYPCPQHPG
ncbi:similar to chromosome 14 open reading frame 138 (predicted), isoform CRA_a [Rattus norvegicus]|uniref:Similar to chromosome 14 open reading frame 138 (Predicted), isoform CRA_a n=1 Tax=Rattus norvegicus TaxID=10116 RepID=A6HBW9_RAT|nr:similar to chromosome 14 open reading frame 138 (predicted), isoform CRA_a [Rattus norvegicus]